MSRCTRSPPALWFLQLGFNSGHPFNSGCPVCALNNGSHVFSRRPFSSRIWFSTSFWWVDGISSQGIPPASNAFLGCSFWAIVKRNLKPSSSLVHEAPTPTISLKKDTISKLACLGSTTLCYRFNGLWPQLVDLHDWISRSWAPDLKGDVFIHPCVIVEFDLK
jgi:hypothetical protein